MSYQMGVVVYKKEPPPIELIYKCLLLPTVDDTQTALANEDIHISEATAIKLRENVQVGTTGFNVIKEDPPRCWDKFKQRLKQLFGGATPFEKSKEFRARSDTRSAFVPSPAAAPPKMPCGLPRHRSKGSRL